MTSTINSFDEKAKTWDQPFRVERARIVADAIKEKIPKMQQLNAVEFGCGTGLVGFFLHELFSHLILVDNSKGMLEVVKQKIGHEGASNMEAMDIVVFEKQIKSGKTFNVLFNLLVLHHIPDTRQILSEWYKCLAPGGCLFITDLDSENGLFHDEGFEGHNGFDREYLGKTTTEVGFEDVCFETVYEITEKTRDGADHTFTLFLMTARK